MSSEIDPSASLIRYRPNRIALPEDGPLSRTFYHQRQHLPGRAPLEASDYENFERYALFHDVFLHVDGRHVCAVGPPLVNLKKALLPMRLRIVSKNHRSSEVLRHRMSHFDRVTVHRFVLPAQFQGSKALNISLQLANGQSSDCVIRSWPLPPVKLQFVTLQKNNPSSWVLDWLRYLHHLGVERVILYDNGSDNVDELASALRAAPQGLQVVLVDWPYAYGPVRSYYNQFCQATQNNHAHACFGQSEWTGHFDIDEYPVCGPATSANTAAPRHALMDWLETAKPWEGLFRLDSYWVPNVADASDASELSPVLSASETSEPPHSVRSFRYRERDPRGKAHKYLVRSCALRMANTHNGKLKVGYFRRAVDPQQWAFLHYKAITTNWRSYAVRGTTEPLDDKLHVEDQRVIQACLQYLP